MKKRVVGALVVGMLVCSMVGCGSKDKVEPVSSGATARVESTKGTTGAQETGSEDADDKQDKQDKEASKDEFEYIGSDIADGICIKKYLGKSKKLVIPETIDGKTVVELDFFNYETKYDVEELVIPDTVVAMGGYSGWEKLKSVVIGDGVKEIPEFCFANDSAIESVVIGDGVEVLRQECFINCGEPDITWGKNVKVIEYGAFCDYSRDTELPEGLEEIGALIFGTVDITIPESVTHISEGAFGYKSVFHIKKGSYVDKWVSEQDPSWEFEVVYEE